MTPTNDVTFYPELEEALLDMAKAGAIPLRVIEEALHE